MLGTITQRTTDGLWAEARVDSAIGRRMVWGWLVSHLRAVVEGLAERRRLRKAERQLEDMTDRMLHDIGIGRSEISHVVRHGRSVDEQSTDPWMR
jgi:uncharacterized protein YjiS (DUF1127 family)